MTKSIDLGTLTNKSQIHNHTAQLSLRGLAEEAKKPTKDQRPLSALDLPVKRVDKKYSKFDTSWTIWEASENVDMGDNSNVGYPKAAMNWCVANTAGSFTYSHMDNLGTLTWARVENSSTSSSGGVKVWGVCRWANLEASQRAMSMPSLYKSNPKIVTEGLKSATGWEFYALRHGDTVCVFLSLLLVFTHCKLLG